MKRKLLLILCFIFLMCSATGCSPSESIKRSFENHLNKSIEQQSGITLDNTYREYRTALSDGSIVNDYYYDENTPVVPDDPERALSSAKAHISFAENSFLRIRYFTDEKMEYEITNPESSFIYLDPGQKIYAVAETSDNTITNMYRFLEFRIYEHTESGKKLISSGYDDKTGLVYTVPDECTGLELSVEPVGEYSKRTLTLNDYYTDDTFRQHSVNGKWIISNNEYKNGKAEISSLDSYVVSYEYDPEKYFFVSSEPNYFWQNESQVIFSQASPTDEISEYSVEVHPFISTTVVCETNSTAEINGKETGKYKKGNSIELSKLKFGDTIVFTCSGKDNIKYDKNVLALKDADDTFGKYTFKVKEMSEDFTFDPSAYKYEHGEIEFRYLGNKITGKISLSAGRQIEYSAVSSDEGYWLPDTNNVITISEDPEETKKAFESIRFYEKKLVTVNFPQPVCGGTITYKKNERTIMSSSEKMFSGTAIKMIYKPWTGWKQKFTDDIFIVPDTSETQTVTVNGLDVNNIFEEDNDHKPKLKITADRQVGAEMKFAVSSSDISVSGLSWNRKENCLYDGDTGTADGITISVSDDSLPKDKMVKLTIEKTDNQKNRYTDIRYIDSIPSTVKTDIYDPNEIRSSDIYFTDINIKISIEDKMVWIPETPENAKLQLRFADTADKELIKKNDLIDRDRLVTVTMQAASGYYITGTNITGDTYQAKMKYSDYLADIEKIIKTHPVKKIYSIDLNTDDKFGKVRYTVNGNAVSGLTELKEEDELIMNYVLENKEYVIYKDFLSAMVDLLSKSPYERSEKIRITGDLDGTVIKREDYITIQKKEK